MNKKISKAAQQKQITERQKIMDTLKNIVESNNNILEAERKMSQADENNRQTAKILKEMNVEIAEYFNKKLDKLEPVLSVNVDGELEGF